MAARASLDRIVRSRTVPAHAILGNEVDLRAYPYRLLLVVAHAASADAVTQTVAAAEVLEAYGRKLVTVSEFGASRVVYAILRRG
ncbi:transcriptional regulator [Micromonospora sp. MS34]|uniref:transcriptional regulator n=1 Tax=Micromonospora sp. MS34 TaxID=3385971 RepID=UPI0039A0C1BE